MQLVVVRLLCDGNEEHEDYTVLESKAKDLHTPLRNHLEC